MSHGIAHIDYRNLTINWCNTVDDKLKSTTCQFSLLQFCKQENKWKKYGWLPRYKIKFFDPKIFQIWYLIIQINMIKGKKLWKFEPNRNLSDPIFWLAKSKLKILESFSDWFKLSNSKKNCTGRNVKYVN